MYCTQFKKKILIWISRSFKKRTSDNTISYIDQSFRFSAPWLILGRSGQNKSWGTENRERTNNYFFKGFEQYALKNNFRISKLTRLHFNQGCSCPIIEKIVLSFCRNLSHILIEKAENLKFGRIILTKKCYRHICF